MNKLTVALATAFAAACGAFSQTFGRAFTALADDTPVGSVRGVPEQPEKPAPAATTKAKAAEKPKSAAAPESPPEPEVKPATESSEAPGDVLTTEDVREAMVPITKRKGDHTPQMLAILQKYGVKLRKDVKPEDFAAVIADFHALEASLAMAD